ncbi:uncharacterized protein VDAG_08036 [Verticillium dahliae VdLs.17]|uniref:Uncharacterized protein n=1 Tax=Verticillium dahliae (strain VdLs.17 / ATCC MYA-4575 / FGSC 10137) TaxID=498257 RepID=G2XD04_VERDV|nr:uncharacterized protein VDAG_08036 [Verticillium dahliae VdLs.17]EGY16872.1 hypothetical protein VDAG_08036 [Verticillium dahliae VdLs.17]KAH6706754.1 hypothetical protein EV126DRAFT_410008 [Verticillium dahliae]
MPWYFPSATGLLGWDPIGLFAQGQLKAPNWPVQSRRLPGNLPILLFTTGSCLFICRKRRKMKLSRGEPSEYGSNRRRKPRPAAGGLARDTPATALHECQHV